MTYQTLFRWLPNALTGIRFVMAILLPAVPANWLFTMLLVAGLTDLVDGWIARKLQLSPGYGQLADPIADKTLVLAAVYVVMNEGWLSWWEMAGLVSRDVVAIILSAVALALGQGNWRRLKPRLTGKVATGAQITAILTLFWFRAPNPGLVWLAAGLSGLAAIDYAWQAVAALRPGVSDRQVSSDACQ